LNDTNDHRILSPELYAQLNLHQSKRGDKPAPRSLEQNETSLRQFNAELLERIGDFRKRNLELASIENALRHELTEQSKRELAREREIEAKFSLEIESLKRALKDALLEKEQANEEWQRKFARMTDESWSKGLDISKLKETFDQERSALLDSKSALEDDLERTRSQLLDQQRRSEKSRSELSNQLKEANELIAELQTALEENKNQTEAITAAAAREKAQMTEQYRSREQHVLTSFDALKLDYERLDRGLREATETAAQLRTELQRQVEKHRFELGEQQKNLRAAFVAEQHELFNENAKMKELLSARDTRNAAESEALLKWRDQLSSFDSHLKGLSDLLKRGRGEALRAAKKVQEEIDFALEHPFSEYLEIANKEVEYLEKQISASSQLSPLRAKHEARLQEAMSHRDAIKNLMTSADTPLREHAKAIQALLKSLESNR
jgi:hypothetical protein